MMMKLSKFAAAFVGLVLIGAQWTILGIAAQKCHSIHIANFIPPGAVRGVVADCVTNNNDLGFKTIPQNKEFVFQACGEPSTYCNVFWGLDKSVTLELLDNFSRFCLGDGCYWALKTDGVYYSDSYPARALVKKLDWKSNN